MRSTACCGGILDQRRLDQVHFVQGIHRSCVLLLVLTNQVEATLIPCGSISLSLNGSNPPWTIGSFTGDTRPRLPQALREQSERALRLGWRQAVPLTKPRPPQLTIGAPKLIVAHLVVADSPSPVVPRDLLAELLDRRHLDPPHTRAARRGFGVRYHPVARVVGEPAHR